MHAQIAASGSDDGGEVVVVVDVTVVVVARVDDVVSAGGGGRAMRRGGLCGGCAGAWTAHIATNDIVATADNSGWARRVRTAASPVTRRRRSRAAALSPAATSAVPAG